MPVDYTQDSPIFGTHSAVHGAYYADTLHPSGAFGVSYETVCKTDAYTLDDPLHEGAPSNVCASKATAAPPEALSEEPHITTPHPSLGGGMVSLVAGTRIETLDGDIAVEELTPDDMIVTRDHGLQCVHWIGQTSVEEAPIFIAKGTFGLTNDLTLHPQQAILLEDPRAQKFLGKDGAMVRASDLLNHTGVSRLAVGTVTYVHLLMDAEQIIRADGVWAESLYAEGDHLDAPSGKVAEDMVDFVTVSAAFETCFDTYDTDVLAA